MKKVLALVLALIMALSLVACSKPTGGDTGDGKVTLDVVIAQYTNYTAEWWKKFEASFEEANKDIDLNIEVISWNDITAQINTRISTGEEPDILNISPFTLYTGEDLLMPVDEYVSDTVKANIIPSFLNANTVDGVVYGLPILASVRCMLVNTDILAEAGVEVPNTWDELMTALKTIKEKCPDVTPWGLDISTDEGQAAFAYYSWNFGGGFVDDNGEWAMNSAENVKALEFINELYHSGLCNANPTTDTRYPVQDSFSAGKVAMLLGPMNAVASDSTVNYEFAPFPVAEEGMTSVSMGVQDQFMAFRDDDAEEGRTEAITKFFDAFYALETYADYMVFEGFLPATLDASDYLATSADKHTKGDGGTGDNDYFALFCPMAVSAKFYPEAKAEWADVKFDVIEAEQAVCEGQMTAQEALDALQASLVG